MINSIKNCLFIIFIIASCLLLTACGGGGDSSGSTSSGSSSGSGGSSAISVSTDTPGAVSSAGATKTFVWTLTANPGTNNNLNGFTVSTSPVNGNLTVKSNTCTGELTSGNSCTITFSYKAPITNNLVIYQKPTFTYSNGQTTITKTGYLDVFPMFYAIPQNAADAQTGPANNLINGMAMNDQGCLYLATANGLSITCDQGKTYSHRTVANGLPTNLLQDVKVTGQTVYVATNNVTSDINAPALSSVAVSTDGGNNFTAITLPNDWPHNAGNTHIALTSNKTLYITGSLSSYVAIQPDSSSASLVKIAENNSAHLDMDAYALGASANGTVYLDSYDTNQNPAVYSSNDDFQNPIFSAPTFPSDAAGFYNPKGTNTIYLYGFGYLGTINNNTMNTQDQLGSIDLNSMSVNQVAVSGTNIYAALSNNNGLAYSTDGGTTYTQVNSNNLATQSAYIPSTDFLLNNVTDNNVYISQADDINPQEDNGGGLGIASIGSNDFTFHSGVNPMPVYADTNLNLNTITALYTYTNNGQDVIFAGGANGFEYSFDGGQTFTYVDTSQYGQVNAFAILGSNLLIGTSKSGASGAILSYTISLNRILTDNPTVITANVNVTDLAVQASTHHVFAASSTGLLYSNNGTNFTTPNINANPQVSGTDWKKLVIDNDNNMFYAINANNQVYYSQLNTLPTLNLNLANNSVPMAPNTVARKLYLFNNILYVATQGSGLLFTPVSPSGPLQSLTNLMGLPAGTNVMDVYARTNALNQTVIYALINSFNSNDASNGLYVSNGAGSFTQLNQINADLDSNMLNVISGTSSAIYIGTMGNAINPNNPNLTINYHTSGNLSKLDLVTNP